MPEHYELDAAFDPLLPKSEREQLESDFNGNIQTAAGAVDDLLTAMLDASSDHISEARVAEAQITSALDERVGRRIDRARGAIGELASELQGAASELSIRGGEAARSLIGAADDAGVSIRMPLGDGGDGVGGTEVDLDGFKNQQVELVCCNGQLALIWFGDGLYGGVAFWTHPEGGIITFLGPGHGEIIVKLTPCDGRLAVLLQPTMQFWLVHGGDELFKEYCGEPVPPSPGENGDGCPPDGSGGDACPPPSENGNGELSDLLSKDCNEILKCLQDLLCGKPRKLWLDCDGKLLVVAREGEQPEGATEVEYSEDIDLEELCRKCDIPKDDEEPPGGFFNIEDIIPPPRVEREWELLRDRMRVCLPPGAPGEYAWMGKMFQTLDALGNFGVPVTILESVFDILKLKLPALWPFTVAAIAISAAKSVLLNLTEKDCPQAPGFAYFQKIWGAVLGFLNLILPGAFDHQIVKNRQEINFHCAKQIPTPGEALSGWLSDAVSDEELKCWIQGNGFVFDSFWDKIAHGARSKPSIAQVISGFRRGFLNRQNFGVAARQLGFTNPNEVQFLLDVTEQIPFSSDITRMMVRDTADDINIDWTKADASFAQKFKGQLRTWAEGQGIPELMMKYIWRAHYRIPSPTQLYDILHRTGRNQFGDFIPSVLKRVEGALEQDDMLPDWIPDLIKISYSLPRVTQITKLHRSGVFDETAVFQEFIKRGLEKKTARALTRDVVRDTENHFRTSPLVTEYSRGYINQRELEAELTKQGATPDAVRVAVDFGKLKLRADQREACLKEVQHRINLGELDMAAARREVFNLTNDRTQARILTDKFFCQRDAKSKTESASVLCGLFMDGSLAQGEFLDRLLTLNYTLDAATMLITRCVNRLEAKERKEEERLARQREAAIRQQRRELQRLEQRATADQRRRERATEAARKAAERRERQLLEASKSLAGRLEADISDVHPVVLSVYRRAVRNRLGSADELAATAKVIAGSRTVESLDEYASEYLTALASTAES